jgi:hypothetical protein
MNPVEANLLSTTEISRTMKLSPMAGKFYSAYQMILYNA